MKHTKKTLLAGFAGLLLACLPTGSAAGASLILGDNYNVTGSGSGFALGSGLNSGITAGGTRLTGSMASGLRYFKPEGTRNNNQHYITNSTKFAFGFGTANSLVSFSPDGTTLANFGPALNTTTATPDIPSVYEIAVDMANLTATGANRISFGISSSTGLPSNWDFGIELLRAADTDTTYTIQKRIDSKSNGGQADTNLPLTNNVGVYGQEVFFLFQISDAGAESVAFNSRLRLSIVAGGATNLIYDTAADSTDLPLGWRFSGANRYLYFHAAANAGPATFDNLSFTSISRPSDPLVKTWTGGGADDNWTTGGNWGGVAPNTGDWLIFGNAVRQNNLNDMVSLLTPWTRFDTGGFVLSGNEWRMLYAISNLAGMNTLNLPLQWQGTAAKSWHVAAGTELRLGSTVSIEIGGDHTFYGGGTMRVTNAFQVGYLTTSAAAFIIADGRMLLDGPLAQCSTRGGLRVGGTAVVVPTVGELVLSNGASLNLTTSGANCRVGNSSNSVVNRLILDHSAMTLTGGELGVPWSAGATGEITQVSSTVYDGAIIFNRDGAGVGSYLVKDSVLEPRRIGRNFAGGSCVMYFDNATLRTSPSASAAFMATLDAAEIRGGGLILDATTVDVTLASPFSGTGILTKSGTYIATLTGTNTYTGNTVVQAGKLVLPTTQTNAATIQVADGAQLGAIVTAQGTTLTAGSLSLAGAGGTLSFDLASLPTPTAPVMQVGTLTASGPVTVNVSGGSIGMTPGTVTLLKWTTLSGAPTFAAGTLPSHINGSLVVNPNSVDLVITGVQGYRWTGATDANWDTFTMNWANLLNNSAAAYTDGYLTEFLDGAATGNTALGGIFNPGLLSVSNNLLAYTWSGGGITTPLVRKAGTNSLTRVDGTDTIGTIELNEGTYALQNNSDLLFTTVLTDATPGLGTFAKQGSGTLTLNTNNTSYDGAIVVQQGTLRVGTNSPALGTTNGATIIQNGASLDLANVQVPHEPVIVAGEGVGGQGALVNLSLSGGVQNNLTDVTMTGDTTFGCANPGRWDIRVRGGTGPGPGLRGNGFNLTKVGGGVVAISSQRVLGTNTLYWELNLGNVVVKEGGLYFEEAVRLGDPSKTITIMPGATLNFFDLGITNPILRTIIATNANLNCGGQVLHTNVIAGPVQMDGTLSMRPNIAIYLINGVMSGNASLLISAGGSGRVMLNAVNTYTGETVVTNGTLGGSGVIAGNLIMLGGTNSPGMGVGMFTVNGNATLAGTTLMELQPGAIPKSDQLSVGGSLTAGGSLVVEFAAGAAAPVAGDVFQLFNKGASGFTNISLPDLSGFPGALAWNTNDLAVNGSIAVVGTVPPSIGNVSVTGGIFTFTGTGGAPGATYYVVTSPDVSAPMAAWVPVATNVFNPDGSFSFTTNIVGGGPQSFFRLQMP